MTQPPEEQSGPPTEPGPGTPDPGTPDPETTAPQPAAPWQQPAPAWQSPQQDVPSQQAPQQQVPWQQPQQESPGPQPWQTAPAAATAATQPGGAPPADPKKKRRTMIVVGVVIALVLAIAATAIILTLQEKRRAEEEAERAAAERVASAGAAVQGLFEAIAAADSAAALGYVEVEGSTEWMTDEVLAVSAELAPITDIVVTPPESVSETYRSADVAISYRLGDTAVEQVYQVRDPEEDNTWIVDGAANELMLYDTFEGLDIELNGTPITTDELTLFPGAYEFTTSTTYFTLTGDTELQVTELFYAESPTFEPALTDEGVTAFRDAVDAAVEECVSSTNLEAGCGLDLPEELSDGTVLEDGTLERTLADDAAESLESMEVTLSLSDPTLAEGSYIGAVDVTARCSQGEVTGTCQLLFAPAIGAPSIVMTDPDLVVLWD